MTDNASILADNLSHIDSARALEALNLKTVRTRLARGLGVQTEIHQ